VGIATADLARLAEELEALRGRPVWAHVDVMDGCFCPQLTMGASLIAATASCGVPVDAHLMVEEPRRFVGEIVAAGAAAVTVHVESTRHLYGTLKELDDLREDHPELIRGLAVNPGTPVGAIESVLGMVDLVLLLAVEPGWPARGLADGTRDRLTQVRALASASASERDIAVGIDGGITRANIAEVAAWGPDLVVSGRAIYDGRDAAANADALLSVLQGASR
jgi:ribulose-phosphate 3-epimerase